MISYLHRNGKGRVYGEAYVSPDSFLDSKSQVGGHSLVAGGSVLLNAACQDSQIVRAHVKDSVLGNTKLVAIDGFGPDVESVGLHDVKVEGVVILRGGWHLDGEAWIHRGIWERAPRHLLIEGNGVHVNLTECVDGTIHIGCSCKPALWWLSHKDRLFRAWGRKGWTLEQLNKVRLACEEWADVREPTGV